MTGRRSKLTDETRTLIARRLAAGDTIADAAAAAAVNVSTLERWLARGRAAQDDLVAGVQPPPAAKACVELLVAIDAAALELTETTRCRIADMLGTGADLAAAAASVQVSARAVELWLARARAAKVRHDQGQPAGAADLVYLQLLADVEAALGTAEVKALETVQRGMLNGEWRAAAWWLERRFPEKYGRRQGRPPGIPDELRQELEQLREQKPAEPVDRLDALLARRAARTAAA